VAFTDQELTCRDCGQTFVWTADEQQFYQEKGYENAPVRCPACRQARRTNNRRDERRSFPAVCAKCGKECEVPFEPKGDRPVYCRECFQEMKQSE